jgi:hypothetical protein
MPQLCVSALFGFSDVPILGILIFGDFSVMTVAQGTMIIPDNF